jgi:3'(2'), 5'-bisphosphate nucleotidase
MSAELESLIEPVVAIAREAGHQIMQVYRLPGEFSIHQKPDDSPVTQADMAAHQSILAGLSRLTPDWPVLSEESPPVPYAERATWIRHWLVDPLDGTRELIKRNDEFTVNIALVEDHEPVLGVIYAPVTEIVYYAARGNGAYKRLPGQVSQPIHVRARTAAPVVVAGSRSHPSKKQRQFLQNLGAHRLLSIGSSLKSCLVAEGRADIYVRLGPTGEWDTAAAQRLVEEAGGAMTDTRLRPLRYNTKESLVNPEFLTFGDGSRDWSRYVPS